MKRSKLYFVNSLFVMLLLQACSNNASGPELLTDKVWGNNSISLYSSWTEEDSFGNVTPVELKAIEMRGDTLVWENISLREALSVALQTSGKYIQMEDPVKQWVNVRALGEGQNKDSILRVLMDHFGLKVSSDEESVQGKGLVVSDTTKLRVYRAVNSEKPIILYRSGRLISQNKTIKNFAKGLDNVSGDYFTSFDTSGTCYNLAVGVRSVKEIRFELQERFGLDLIDTAWNVTKYYFESVPKKEK